MKKKLTEIERIDLLNDKISKNYFITSLVPYSCPQFHLEGLFELHNIPIFKTGN